MVRDDLATSHFIGLVIERLASVKRNVKPMEFVVSRSNQDALKFLLQHFGLSSIGAYIVGASVKISNLCFTPVARFQTF